MFNNTLKYKSTISPQNITCMVVDITHKELLECLTVLPVQVTMRQTSLRQTKYFYNCKRVFQSHENLRDKKKKKQQTTNTTLYNFKSCQEQKTSIVF